MNGSIASTHDLQNEVGLVGFLGEPQRFDEQAGTLAFHAEVDWRARRSCGADRAPCAGSECENLLQHQRTCSGRRRGSALLWRWCRTTLPSYYSRGLHTGAASLNVS